MKIQILSALAIALLAGVTARAATAPAVNPPCADLQKAERTSGKFFKAKPYTSQNGRMLSQQIAQLRATLVHLGVGDAATMSPEQLDDAADGVKFFNYVVAGKTFQCVDVALGDNPMVVLFKPDTTDLSGIESLDGTLTIDGTYCELNTQM